MKKKVSKIRALAGTTGNHQLSRGYPRAPCVVLNLTTLSIGMEVPRNAEGERSCAYRQRPQQDWNVGARRYGRAMYRQGDILVLPLPEEAAHAAILGLSPAPRDPRGRLVLALGEVTGHAHAVVGPGELYRSADPLAPAFLDVPSGARIVHEEHGAISLPRGWYRVVRQREYVPGAVRAVRD